MTAIFSSLKTEAIIPITNAGPVLEQKQISLSVSSFVIYSFSYSDTANFVPSGKPKRQPIINAVDDTFCILNIFERGLPKRLPKCCDIFDVIIRLLKIKKGKRKRGQIFSECYQKSGKSDNNNGIAKCEKNRKKAKEK